MPAPINSGSGGSSQSAVVRGGTLRGLPIAPPAPQIVAGPAASIGIGVGHLWVKHGTTWKEPKLWVKHDTTWKEPTAAFVKSGSTWKQFYAPAVVTGDPTLVLDLDFTTGTLDSKVTFTRTTTATYVNSSGLITSAAIDAPRFDYDPSTLAARGLLIEEQRTNAVLWSAMPDGVWAGFINGSGSASDTANAGTAPDGTATATKFSINRSSTGDYAEFYQNSVNVSSATGVGSIWLKAFAAGDVGKQITFAFHNGGAYDGATAITLTAAWVRYVITASALSGANQVLLGYYAGSVGTGPVDFLAWGIQAEAGAFATSYIPTTSAAVTRAADSAVMTGTGFTSWFNQPAGTFVVTADWLTTTSPYVYLFQANIDGSDYYSIAAIKWGFDTNMYGLGKQDGASSSTPLFGAPSLVGARFKSGLAYASADLAVCLNGGTVGSTTTFTPPTTMNRLNLLSQAGAATASLSGHLTTLRYYNVRKTNSELVTLTT